MAWLTSPAWVALFLRATGSLAAIFTQYKVKIKKCSCDLKKIFK